MGYIQQNVLAQPKIALLSSLLRALYQSSSRSHKAHNKSSAFYVPIFTERTINPRFCATTLNQKKYGKAVNTPIFTKPNNVQLNFMNTSRSDFYPDRSRNIESYSKHLFRRWSKLWLSSSRVLQNSHFLDKVPYRTSVRKATYNPTAARPHTHGLTQTKGGCECSRRKAFSSLLLKLSKSVIQSYLQII